VFSINIFPEAVWYLHLISVTLSIVFKRLYTKYYALSIAPKVRWLVPNLSFTLVLHSHVVTYNYHFMYFVQMEI